MRSVQKMLELGRHAVIDFGHIRFVVRDGVVTYVFRKDEFVGCCVAHHDARDIESLGEGWCRRSMVPARVTRQCRQSRRTVWDRAGMGAAVISELEARQLVYINRKIGRMSSIDHSKYAIVVELIGHMTRGVGRVLRQVARSDGGKVGCRLNGRVMAVIRWGRLHREVFAGCMGWMGAAVISELEARQLVYINGKIGRMNSIGHSKHAIVVE